MPVMKEYYDLFLYDPSGSLPCTTKGFHEIRTGYTLPIKKNPYRVPFALKDKETTRRDDSTRSNYTIMFGMGGTRGFGEKETFRRYAKI